MKNLKMIAAFVALSMAFSCQNETTENLELENSKVSKKLTFKESLKIFKAERGIKTNDVESLQLRRSLPDCSSYYYKNSSNFYESNGIRFDFNEPGISNADMANFYSQDGEPFMELIVDYTYYAAYNEYIKDELEFGESGYGIIDYTNGSISSAAEAISILNYDRTNIPIITLVDGLTGGASLIEYNTNDCEKRILVDKNWAYEYSLNGQYPVPTDAFKFVLAYSNIKDYLDLPNVGEDDFITTFSSDSEGVETYLTRIGNGIDIYDTFYWYF